MKIFDKLKTTISIRLITVTAEVFPGIQDQICTLFIPEALQGISTVDIFQLLQRVDLIKAIIVSLTGSATAFDSCIRSLPLKTENFWSCLCIEFINLHFYTLYTVNFTASFSDVWARTRQRMSVNRIPVIGFLKFVVF